MINPFQSHFIDGSVLYPKPKPQSTFTEKNRELQEGLRIKKYGMRGLTVKMRAFLFVWLSPWKKKFNGIKWLNMNTKPDIEC